ncbi:VTT domain-containing protein [Levilactobacillus brevis]|uniref:VTT domain-containing protein n=1 Tax=Levilactobacillus brevis TaxID=1580 RepID=UPI001866B569|nr:VTT domain-containing protein [Levilactobacillus brevis]QOP51850.1 VTT domain-containing protein [Levilactobacillus brevis]
MTNRYKYWLIGLGIVGLVALLSWLWIDYRTTGTTILATHFNRDRAVLINQLRHQGRHNAIILVAAIAIGSAIPGVPISAIAILSGIFFGRWPGFVINLTGITLGNLLAIYLMIQFPKRSKPSRFQYLTDKLKTMRHPRLGLSIGYAIPMLPTVLVNYTALELRPSFTTTLSCIVMGSLPVSFLYAFGGDELLSGNIKTVILAVVLVLLLVGLYEIIRRDQRRKAQAD